MTKENCLIVHVAGRQLDLLRGEASRNRPAAIRALDDRPFRVDGAKLSRHRPARQRFRLR